VPEPATATANTVAPVKQSRCPRKPPPPAEQKRIVDRADAVAAATQSFFSATYQRAKTLANARLAIVYGVLGAAFFSYANGIASTWLTAATDLHMWASAGIFGAAAGVLLARSLPAIRAIDISEGHITQGRIEAKGVVERVGILTPVLPKLPEPLRNELLRFAISPRPERIVDADFEEAAMAGKKDSKANPT
jgi:hypothetical protein